MRETLPFDAWGLSVIEKALRDYADKPGVEALFRDQVLKLATRILDAEPRG